MTAGFRKVPSRRSRTTPTNVSLDAGLVAEAKELGVSISQAASRGLEEAVRKTRAERWLTENRTALDSYNDWVEANRLPLEEYRLF
ncbi:MAG TPA: type II toxin-antitoxin system CcdA family antitoxin [Sphingomicrobium sp.]|jgi:antitoxin CcdA|nr:type II toxin-antitoxin system CcdA family antitoxin [Sphingomicrobium sp.]